jgi:opacity protein-like surface antigen
MSFSSSASGSTSALAFGATTSTSSSPARAADPAPPSPSAYGFNERDYNLDITFGVAVVRFRSPAFYATAVGPHVSAAFYLKDWLAVEGAITAAFAPSIYSDNVRYLSYAGGLKIPFSLGRKRLEPWAHALAGGVHVGPQTALGSRNGFELTAGGGLDYALTPRVSLRIEADYLGSRMFSQWLNSGQGLAGVVFHF